MSTAMKMKRTELDVNELLNDAKVMGIFATSRKHKVSFYRVKKLLIEAGFQVKRGRPWRTQ